MPTFIPGETKTAIVPVTVKPSGLSAEVELFLGPDDLTKVATSGRKPFVSTASQQQVSLPVIMPTYEDTYKVFLDVYVGGALTAGFVASEDIVISITAGVKIDSFEMRIVAPGILSSRITLINGTGQTLRGEGRLISGYRNSVTAYVYAYPGTSFEYNFGSFGGYIGDLLPGRTVFESEVDFTRNYAFRAGWLNEGARAYAYVSFMHTLPNVPPYGYILVEQNYEGVFSSQWQTWIPTTWREPSNDNED